jgi:endonuclease/exonuclease/phosphatase family metal-dependent hydrolase
MKKYFILLILLNACATKQDQPLNYLSILTFNVENLFDTVHDSGMFDYTYLPMKLKQGPMKKTVAAYCASIDRADWKQDCRELDWDLKKFNDKILRVAQVISESTTGCPDVVVLQEIENKYVLQKLSESLTCSYPFSKLSGLGDARGMRVAVLSKLEIKSSRSDAIPFSKSSEELVNDSRGVLSVVIANEDLKFRVLGIHLPAPFHPVQARKDALKFLRELADADNIPTIIAGDWNIPESENRAESMLDLLRRDFVISDDVIRASSADQGSTYYAKDGTWSFLDKVALGRNSFDRVECRVINFVPGQRNAENGAPQGVSDHFPVLCRASY